MSCLTGEVSKNRGFTLIEIMITMVIALVVLGGLMTNFIQQNSEYKYQSKRIDAVQDLEFAIKFIAEDLRGALMVTTADISITNNAVDPFATTAIDFNVWENNPSFWGPLPLANQQTLQDNNNFRATRRYTYDSGKKSLLYDRNIIPNVSMAEILPHVTLFKVFNDSARPAVAYTGIPSAQPTIDLVITPVDPADLNLTGVSGYTILIELEVDAGYKTGSFVDVRGNNVGVTGKKRIWRYIQVYPGTAVR